MTSPESQVPQPDLRKQIYDAMWAEYKAQGWEGMPNVVAVFANEAAAAVAPVLEAKDAEIAHLTRELEHKTSDSRELLAETCAVRHALIAGGHGVHGTASAAEAVAELSANLFALSSRYTAAPPQGLADELLEQCDAWDDEYGVCAESIPDPACRIRAIVNRYPAPVSESVPATPQEADKARCQAMIWPSWAPRWIACDAPLGQEGTCKRYGRMHDPRQTAESDPSRASAPSEASKEEGFFEEDEPAEGIKAAFDNGIKFVTAPSTSAAPIRVGSASTPPAVDSAADSEADDCEVVDAVWGDWMGEDGRGRRLHVDRDPSYVATPMDPDDVVELASTPPASGFSAVLIEIAAERTRQDERWGEQNHFGRMPANYPVGDTPNAELAAFHWKNTNAARVAWMNEQGFPRDRNAAWDGILLEEVYEALAEDDPRALRTELIQVAAVATAWIEAIDRRTSPPSSPTSEGNTHDA